MKKFVLLLGSALVLSACSHTQPSKPAEPETTQPQSQSDTQKEFAEMAQAIQSGQAVRCQMTPKDDSTTLTYTVKGKKVKMIGLSSDPKSPAGSMLSDGTYMYTWSDETKQGIKFALPTEEELKAAASSQPQTAPDFSKPEEQQKYQDLGYKINCNAENIADSEFNPPADVKFVDNTQMMQQYQR